MPRFVARVFDDAKGRAFIDIEAATVPEAMARLLERGFSVDGIFSPENAPSDVRGNLLDGNQITAGNDAASTSLDRFLLRSLEFAGLAALILAFFIALGRTMDSGDSMFVTQGNQFNIPISPHEGGVHFPWLGLLTMAAWALPSIVLRPLTNKAMTPQQRVGVLALLGLAGMAWFLWISGTLVGKPYESMGVMLCLGLSAAGIYLALGAGNAEPSHSKTMP
jgi:hypothetical protein